MPTNSCQRASTSPRSSRPSCRPSLDGPLGRAVRRGHPLVQRLRRDRLLVGGVGEPVDGRAERGERAVQRLPDHRGAGVRVGRELAEPVVQRLGDAPPAAVPDRPAWSPAARTAAPRPCRARPASRPGARRPRRPPRRGTRSRTSAITVPRSRAVVQQFPRHRVRVPRRGRDEQPQVGGGQQLGGELRGCWSTTESMSGASRNARPGPSAGAATSCRVLRVGAGLGGARQPRQQFALAEPRQVVGVAHQHRRPGGRPQHAGRADRRPDQAVDQGGLAGAGGAADHHQQRRVEPREARQKIVVQLRHQRRADPPGIVGRGHDQGVRGPADRRAQPAQRGRERADRRPAARPALAARARARRRRGRPVASSAVGSSATASVRRRLGGLGHRDGGLVVRDGGLVLGGGASSGAVGASSRRRRRVVRGGGLVVRGGRLGGTAAPVGRRDGSAAGSSSAAACGLRRVVGGLVAARVPVGRSAAVGRLDAGRDAVGRRCRARWGFCRRTVGFVWLWRRGGSPCVALDLAALHARPVVRGLARRMAAGRPDRPRHRASSRVKRARSIRHRQQVPVCRDRTGTLHGSRQTCVTSAQLRLDDVRPPWHY